jgi:hypothetical protein
VAIGEWWSGSYVKVYISKEDLKKAGTGEIFIYHFCTIAMEMK